MNALITSLKKWFETSNRKQKRTAALFMVGLLSTFGLMMLNGSSGAMNDPLQTSPFYLMGVFAKLAVVLLLILACSVVLRRWSQPGCKGRREQQMQVIETIRLSPKQSLHIVSVGDRQLLIGATDQNVTLITAIELDLNSRDVPLNAPATTTDFVSLLQAVNLRAPAGTPSKS